MATVMTKRLTDFINEEMRKRDMSMREFATFMGTTHASISRALARDEETLPTLEFLVKLAQATKLDICTIVALVVPETTGVNAEVLLLAQAIAKLPPEKQALVDDIILGMTMKRNDTGA